MGSLFRPKYPPSGMTFKDAKAAGALRESDIWWLKYRASGRIIRESSGTANEKEAERLLKVKEGRAEEGKPILPRADKVTVRELIWKDRLSSAPTSHLKSR